MSESTDGIERGSIVIKLIFRKPAFGLLLIIVLHMALLLPTVGLYGMGWDEQIDSNVAHSYISWRWGWLAGAVFDPGNTRLPMYSTAIILAVLRNRALIPARVISSIVGAFAVIGVYVFCKREFDYRRGLLACLIFATSPYFLSYSRLAYTEGDAFITCALIWVLVCVSVLQEKRTLGWAAVTAVVLGLALSSKMSAIATFPAIFVALVFFSNNKAGLKRTHFSRTNVVITGILLALLAASIVGGWGIAYLVWGKAYLSKTVGYSAWFALGHYCLAFLLWLSIVIYFYTHRELVVTPLTLSFLVLVFSFLTFVVLPPVHSTNPNIIVFLVKTSLFEYAHKSLAFIYEAAALHFGCVLFKSSFVIGALLWLSLFVTIVQFRSRREIRLPLMVFIFYFLFILKMPWAHARYMVPLLPILAVFTSDQLLRLFSKKRIIAIVVFFLATCSLIVDMFLCYPDYNYNGYQWLGERHFAGRSTIGPRSIVQTTADGVEQSLKWARDNVQEGETVFSYIRQKHIIKAVCPNPKFRIINGLEKPKSAFMRADYVITVISSEFERDPKKRKRRIHNYPYDVDLLKANFTEVFSVKRTFDIEVARVWRRNVTQNDP